jgi:hypothetical protein
MACGVNAWQRATQRTKQRATQRTKQQAMQLLRGSDVQILDPRVLRLLLCTFGHTQNDFLYCTGGSTLAWASSARRDREHDPIQQVSRKLATYKHVKTRNAKY